RRRIRSPHPLPSRINPRRAPATSRRPGVLIAGAGAHLLDWRLPRSSPFASLSRSMSLTSSLTPVPSPLTGWTQPIDALRETGAYFHQRGWSVGTSSNYSVVLQREPLELIVTASGMDKGRLERCDFV